MRERTKRNTNIEWLRIVLMLFIIMHHCIVNGYGLQGQLNGTEAIQMQASSSAFLAGLNSIVVIGVNVFFLISGYFQIRFSLEKFIKMILDIYLYGGILTLLALLFGKASLNMLTIQYLILPFQKYWFILVYLILMVLSPLLNNALEQLNEKVAKTIYVVVFLVTCGYGFVFEATWLGLNNGYSVVFAMFLYLSGYMMRKYELLAKGGQISHIVKWLGYTFMTAVLVCCCILIGKNELAWSCFSYNQPFIVLASIHFFWVFAKWPVRKKGISEKCVGLAKHILPVYYIHTSTIFAFYRNIPLQYVGNNFNSIVQLIFLIVYAILIFGVCVLIDIIKGKLLDKLIVRFDIWISKHLLKMWNAFFNR